MKAAQSYSELLDSGKYMIDCRGAWLCPYVEGGATIVQIGGEIDAYNADQLSDKVLGYSATAAALVIDTTAVEFLAVTGLRDLIALDQKCHDSGIEWTLIAGETVRRMLKISGVHGTLPVAESISTALQSLTVATIGYWSGG